MKPRKIKTDVYWVGAVDWDRRLFDELIPLPDGTSYNSYLIKGSEKTALIDTVDPTMTRALIDNLQQLDVRNIDYVVANHAEQDHSGTLPQVLEQYPNAKIVVTPKCKDLLMSMLLIHQNRIMTVEDGDNLSLGNKTLEFIHAPWVHWPETMLSYLREDRILFTCDLFGSHFATSDLYVTDEATVYEAAKRYYAEIMMPFRKVIERNLEKIRDLQINMIAPSHGPVYDKPEFILEAYRDWVYAPPKNVVVLPYISARTAPKSGGVDDILTAIVSEAEKEQLVVEMEKIARERKNVGFTRDAKNVRDSELVVLIGVRGTRKFGLNCGACGYANCEDACMHTRASQFVTTRRESPF